ncbi:papain family cysteine protease [Ancylostoma duodenale]|uniref:Papain family cysteine protease n=1 Tax=Ancylostoma duodenale TaxID=51022 RepID=A0A0C2G8K9_9BILA|nr:papain family cysteine protease [Ancylostoma duodenale]
MLILIAVLATATAKNPITIEEFLSQPIPRYAEELTGQALVDYVNERQPFFKAEYSPTAEQFMESSVMGAEFLGNPDRDYVTTDIAPNLEIPKRFDARERWPECTSIGFIRDQSNCVVFRRSFRMEISSPAVEVVVVSGKGRMMHWVEWNLMLEKSFQIRCAGGWPIRAFNYFSLVGICTGGWYREKVREFLIYFNYSFGFEEIEKKIAVFLKNVCKPYPLYPCGQHQNQTYYGPCSEKLWDTPVCRSACQFKYPIPYRQDKIYVASSSETARKEFNLRILNNVQPEQRNTSSTEPRDVFFQLLPPAPQLALLLYGGNSTYIIPKNQTIIMTEIMTHGPVVATYKVYEDFAYYKGGVYVHTAGEQKGAHAVRVIGWGEENSLPYWLVANSWNTDWGEKGYFRILRGSNHCDIENQMIAGMVNV